ncbi:hypothetical protein M422DRAFT_251007 [Sphaerobolus stellatus SS14]|uniref:RNA-binding domain-containing protein n=1 Tax=Sphaerobolus stellatus (strain SS14) TaxID=990650 RepID=A0A0C9VFB2_SPHS4|nr:hypothetical protein M422DRAFT_251007 [Sphaerobolus stellatus SS14]
MSSPPPRKDEPSGQDWNMDHPASENSNGHHAPVQETRPHHENDDSGKPAAALEENGPLLPSKTAGGPDLGVPGSKSGTIYREKQVKPNKVYVGGLPEHTRQEDLQACFGKLGHIQSIELKTGFGFVEFVDREAAEESVAKYNEGYFMGNKIRVELSHGGGRTAKYAGEPGACFKCGQQGHWARECPNHVVTVGHRKQEPTLLDRVSHPPRDLPPPPSRNYSPYREEYRQPAPPPPPPPPAVAPPARDSRYGYDYPPPVPSGREPRDYRPRDYRPATPPPSRDYREYPPATLPPPRSSREVDDYRRDYRGPPTRYESRSSYYPDDYGSRSSYLPPRDAYEPRGFDRRPPPPNDRYSSYPPHSGRPRTPPPPRPRDDYERMPPPRDYPPPDYRGRPASPGARYSDARAPIDTGRYRRRSQSPVPRSSAAYPPGPPSAGYSGPSAYPSSSSNAHPNSYPPPPPPQGRSSATNGGSRDRDYPPRPPRDSGESASYPRRP